MATSYWDYIRVGDLLELQGGLPDDEGQLRDDEVLFITVHQVFELWFKLVLREMTTLRDLFTQAPVPETALSGAARSMDRIQRILRTSVAHWEVVESLTTRDYLDFRDKLFPASGFQSAQMREIEVMMGLTGAERVGLGSEGAWLRALQDHRGERSPAYVRVKARMDDTPTLRDAVHTWLWRTPIDGSTPSDEGDNTADDRAVERFLERYLAAHTKAAKRTVETIGADSYLPPEALEARFEGEKAQARAFFLCDDLRQRRVRAAMLFIESYRQLPLLAWPRQVLDGLISMEQAFTVFRQRHARMVERVIGRRVGTGGSNGVDYLDETALAYRVFRDLGAIRTFQLRAADLPLLADTDFYDFQADFSAEGPTEA